MSKLTRKQKNRVHRSRMVLTVLLDYFKHFGKKSAFPSQETIIKQLKRVFGYDIKKRQLNYVLADLESSGIIRRYKRHRYDKIKGYIFKSTRYLVAQSGWRLAALFRLIPWKEAHRMINAIKKGAQAEINKAKEWITPDWMASFEKNILKNITVPDG